MEKAHLYEALYLVNHGIDEAVRGVQRLKKSPKLFMETYHKSMAGRRSRINLQFMLEMRKLEEDDECRFEEEYNVWLSDEPLTNDEICQLMREVERQRKQEGKAPLVQFLTSRKRSRKTRRENGAVHSNRKPNGAPTPVLKKKIQPAFTKVGIVGVGWHTFRHTVGTMLAEMGEHQLTIRDYLRHSNLHVTNKYLQATPESKRLAQGKLVDAILPGGLLSVSKSTLIQ